MTAARPKEAGPTATELVEESVHLLRGAPASAWAIYLSGVTPWLLGLSWFWATASWFAPRPAEILWHASGLALLYLWLKTAQAAFCARLRAARLGVEPPSLGPKALWRIAVRQAALQGWAVPVLPVAGALTVPAGAAWMFFENATALAVTEDAPGETLGGRAWREAKRWPGPAHLALLFFSGLWLCAWVNIASTFYVLPWLARTLLGVENLFALSGWWGLNSTFLALVTALSWLAVDPLVKAYHVLRTFYGEARLTGADLRLEIRRPANARRGAARSAAVVLAACWFLSGGGEAGALRAQDDPAPAATPAEVDAALDSALRAREFLWRLEPLPVPEAEEAGDSALKALARRCVETIMQIASFWDGSRTGGTISSATTRPSRNRSVSPVNPPTTAP